MSGTTPILVAAALSNRSWRAALQRQVRDHESDLIVELVRDRHQAMAEVVDIVVVDDDTSWVNAAVVGALNEAGKTVVGVFDPDEGDGYGQQFLSEAGIYLIVAADLATDDLIAFLRDNRPNRVQGLEDRSILEAYDDRTPLAQRRIVAIGGPSGAGSTEVSIAIAHLLSAEPTVLVDADESHPALARRLGLSIHPHIVTAVDAIRHTTADADDQGERGLCSCVARPALGQARFPFQVIAGLASRDDWSLLRADDAVALLDQLTQRYTHVIAKVGSNLDEIPGVPRYSVSREIVRHSDRIIAVAHASPTGLLHFVDWLVDAVALADDNTLDVVLNRAPSSPAARGQLEDELRNITGDRIDSITFVPTDRRIERAGWDATIATKGPFMKALRPLAGESGHRRGRWRRPMAKVRPPALVATGPAANGGLS